MPREFTAYCEVFTNPRKDGKGWDWLMRVYSYAPEPGLIAEQKGNAPSEEKAKESARAAANKVLEKHRVPATPNKKEGA